MSRLRFPERLAPRHQADHRGAGLVGDGDPGGWRVDFRQVILSRKKVRSQCILSRVDEFRSNRRIASGSGLMSRYHRREFLADVGKGMLVAGVGSALAQDLGLAPATLA